jgi:hypothetical protein
MPWEQARFDQLLARYPDALLEPEEDCPFDYEAYAAMFGPRRDLYPRGGYGNDDPVDWSDMGDRPPRIDVAKE